MKSGFVNIVGNPNVGKSTLMNALVGEKLSIITAKSQTTRHRIMGIVTGADFQIVYSDTPGVVRPSYKLQESMLRFSQGAITDADVILYVTDVVEKIDKNLDFIERVRASCIPTLLVVNKIDLSTPEKLDELVARWGELLPEATILPISATENFGVASLLPLIVERLPEAPAYYDGEMLTDRSLKFFASEIIREKILLNYDQEVPYSTEVVIEKYEEGETLDRISAVILVMRRSQKGIVIGHKGESLKRVGTAARKDLEKFLNKKVFLEIFVKVEENWRDSESKLKGLGYAD